MTDATSITISDQRLPEQQRSAGSPAVRVTGKVKVAIEAMVWIGLPRKEAAAHAGISEHGLYKALRKPPVRAFYLSELDVLRTSARARNIHVLEEVRDQTGNQMARVNAVKALEQLSDEQVSAPGRAQLAGVVIQIVNSPAPLTAHERATEAKPLIDNETGSDI